MNATRFQLILAAALASAVPAFSQTPLHVHTGTNGNDYLGYESATGIGDIDGDGVPDYAFGAPSDASEVGYVRVIAGATGETLATLLGGGVDVGGNHDQLGCSIAGIGDVTGDQVPDLLVGVRGDDSVGYNYGVAHVYSGSDGTIARTHSGASPDLYFGSQVAKLGDSNGDGVSEYLCLGYPNVVYCYDGATGTQLWTHSGDHFDNFRFSTTANDVTGDVNGDGMADALVGAVQVGGEPPFVLLLNGVDGTLIHSIPSSVAYSLLGYSLTWLDDLDGDGRCEFAVGHPHDTGGPKLHVFDGATFGIVYSIVGNAGLGTYACSLSDQDGDGIRDLATHDNSRGRLYSGATGDFLHAVDPHPLDDHYQVRSVAPVGDLDGDGKEDLLVGFTAQGIPGGLVMVFSSSSLPFADEGFALAGTFGDPLLEVESSLLPGSIYRASLSNANLWAPAVLAIGLSAVDLPLLGGTLVPSPDLLIFGATDQNGRLDSWARIPLGVPSGLELLMQYWIVDGNGAFGYSASNAVKGVFP